MASQKDSNPNSGARKGGGRKNEDGRIGGEKYNGQCNDTEGGLPQRKASKGAKLTFSPNEDVKPLDGNREGLESGAY